MFSPENPSHASRRGFLKKSLALILGGVAALVPVTAGLAVLFDPLRRKSAVVAPVRITTLDALPADGLPRRFLVVGERTDAWNKTPLVRLGTVYLRRTTDDKVTALNVICPHAGCAVDVAADNDSFRCPCHGSTFTLDGAIANPKSPSPRALDSLPVRIGDDGAIWVTFENFHAGRPDKVPVA